MTPLENRLAGPAAEPADLLRDAAGRPLRDLRISVTDRCNFRCVYCMPKEVFGNDYAFLERKELLTFEEITRAARVFRCLGIAKIRLTGGEPLVRRNVEQLVAMLAAIPGLDLTLTTNGSVLSKKAAALARAGLKRVTVSLDALDDPTFKRMNDV
ncbi:MAG: radical SAM protein, partial [Burkholderiales bacterium]